jgi:hypothetical protein
MKEYRFTSEHFVMPGETGDADAVMSESDLQQIKKLAGIPVTEEFYTAGGSDPQLGTPTPPNTHPLSPVGSNPSITAMEKQQLEKQHNIKPGTPEWFKLWFSLPYLTGEKPVGDAPAPKIPRQD